MSCRERGRGHRQHAPDPAQARLRGRPAATSGQGRVHQSRQSVKDRAALAIIRDAEAKGLLKPGGIIVEGTAGNTGIGLALVAKRCGYRTVIVIPETQTQEKKDMLRLCGAELRRGRRRCPTRTRTTTSRSPAAWPRSWPRPSRTAPSGPTSSTMPPTAQAISRPPARRSGTQTDGKVDGFVCAVGTGGTLAGVAHGAEGAATPTSASALADPDGRRALQLLHRRRAEGRGHLHHRGHRPGPRSPGTSKGAPVDLAYQIPDEEALPIVFDLARSTRASASAAPPASTSPAPSAWPAISGPATPSSPSSATTARATSRACSTRRSCAPRACRCPPG